LNSLQQQVIDSATLNAFKIGLEHTRTNSIVFHGLTVRLATRLNAASG